MQGTRKKGDEGKGDDRGLPTRINLVFQIINPLCSHINTTKDQSLRPPWTNAMQKREVASR